jgi:hypothetical protein
MPKKCIPGVVCVENMTLFLLLIIILLLCFLWFQTQSSSLGKKDQNLSNSIKMIERPEEASINIIHDGGRDIRGDPTRCSGYRGDPLSNAYVPPIHCDGGSLMQMPPMMNVASSAGVPINIRTQSYNSSYSQVGILTRKQSGQSEILPLMGRRTITSRDKWQYYTISGGGAGGNLQTKLPIRVKGKNCSDEYGCGEIYNGEEVYVEGFQELFQATMYESGLFSYIPY